MKSSSHFFITVIGNVGSGKTTFSQKLSKDLDAEFVAADELYKENPFFQDAVVDRARWSLASDVWFLMKRVQIAKELERKLLSTSVIQDSGIPMSWVYSHSRLKSKHMNKKEIDLYDELFAQFCSNLAQEDILIYLHFPLQTLMNRIKQRGRDFELQYFTRTYLRGLEESLRQYVQKKRASGSKVLEYTQENGDTKDITRDIRRILQTL